MSDVEPNKVVEGDFGTVKVQLAPGGTFVIEANGEFDGGASEGAWQIVPGSGTGDLIGIQGEGGFEARSGPNASYHLDVAFG